MLLEIWEETGTKPPALAARPELARRWVIPYEVWVDLSGSRNYHAGGFAEIPFSEFFLWAVAHRYTPAELECMWEDIHAIDKIWLTLQAETQKESTEKQKSQAKSNDGRRSTR